MKPSEIFKVMDLARNARLQGRVFNPIFVGPPGIAKSAIVQQWAKQNGYGLIDIRAALREAPDLIGFPRVVVKDGKERTVNATPEMWPDSGKWVIFIDEVNRGTQSVMNAFMQLLTDRTIGSHKLPEDVIIVSAINPEDEQNDVNTMDSALKDRFEFFYVEYDKKDHLAYMKANEYNQTVINWVETMWTYARPEKIGDGAGAKYLSPRSIEKLDTAIKAGAETMGVDFEKMVYTNILGQLNGQSFFKFKTDDRHVTYKEIKDKRSRSRALERLKTLCNPEDYKAASVSLTCSDIIENGSDIEDELLVEVILTLPADQSPDLLYRLEQKRGLKHNELSNRIIKDYPTVYKHFHNTLVKA